MKIVPTTEHANKMIRAKAKERSRVLRSKFCKVDESMIPPNDENKLVAATAIITTAITKPHDEYYSTVEQVMEYAPVLVVVCQSIECYQQ